MQSFSLLFLASSLLSLCSAMYSSDAIVNQASYMIFELGDRSEVPGYLMSAAENGDVPTFRFILDLDPDFAQQSSESIEMLDMVGTKYLQVLDTVISSNCAGCLEALFEGREVTTELVQRCIDMNMYGHAAIAAVLEPMWLANLADEPVQHVQARQAQVIPPPAAPKGPKLAFIIDSRDENGVSSQSPPYHGQYFHGGRAEGGMHVYQVDEDITVMCMVQGIDYVSRADFDHMNLKKGPEALSQYLYARPGLKGGVIFWYNQATGEAQTHTLDTVKNGPVLLIFDGENCLPELVNLQKGHTIKSQIKPGFNMVFFDGSFWDHPEMNLMTLGGISYEWDDEAPFESAFGNASRILTRTPPEAVFGVKFE